MSVPTPEYIAAHTDRSGGPDGCWLWLGAKNPGGYGVYGHSKIHRLALEQQIARSLVSTEHACHTCDNPPCVNPAHLYVGDPKTNARDRKERGRSTWRRDQCLKGHPLIEDNVVIRGRVKDRICRTCLQDYLARTRHTPEYRARQAATKRRSRAAAQKPAEKTAEPIPADSSDRPRSVATSRRPSQRRLARH